MTKNGALKMVLSLTGLILPTIPTQAESPKQMKETVQKVDQALSLLRSTSDPNFNRCTTCSESIQSRLSIEEDPEGVFGGEDGYVFSNESHPHLFREGIKRSTPGTLVAVGTIRVLVDAGMGNFDQVIFLDLDRNVLKFNRAHLKLLQAVAQLKLPPTKQRLQYIAAMHCRWLDTKELSAFEVQMKKNPKESSFSAETLEYFKKNWPKKSCDPSALPKDIADPLTEIWHYYRDSEGSSGLDKGVFATYYAYSEPERPAYYWESDASWQKVQKLVSKRDRAHVISGDIYGEKALQSLGHALRSRSERVAVYDISNILDYIRPTSDPSQDQWSRKAYQSFIRNLKSLPVNADATVVFTTRNAVSGFKVSPDPNYSWTYAWTTMSAASSKDDSKWDEWFKPDSIRK